MHKFNARQIKRPASKQGRDGSNVYSHSVRVKYANHESTKRILNHLAFSKPHSAVMGIIFLSSSNSPLFLASEVASGAPEYGNRKPEDTSFGASSGDSFMRSFHSSWLDTSLVEQLEVSNPASALTY